MTGQRAAAHDVRVRLAGGRLTAVERAAIEVLLERVELAVGVMVEAGEDSPSDWSRVVDAHRALLGAVETAPRGAAVHRIRPVDR